MIAQTFTKEEMEDVDMCATCNSTNLKKTMNNKYGPQTQMETVCDKGHTNYLHVYDFGKLGRSIYGGSK